MDFKLSDEQRQIQMAASEFARKEVEPNIGEYEEDGTFPWPLVKKAAELGFLGIITPEKYGGCGSDTLSYALLMEELSRVSIGFALIISCNNSPGPSAISDYGTEEQKQKYLPLLASGEKLACWALTESEAGSDISAQKAPAVLENDQWVLNGNKIFITNAPVADICVGTFRTDSDPHKGLSAFIIETDAPGFEIGKIEHKMGICCSPTAEIVLSDCRIPGRNLLGKRGEGFKIAVESLNGGRITIASQSLGLSEGALEAAIKHAKERKQFGHPVANFQAIQFRLADMATEIEMARWAIYRAAWLKDQRESFIKEASMAKVFASEMAERIASKGLQIFGGYGYLKGYAVERFYRDQRILQLYEGTSDIQRTVIARQILGGKFK